MSANAAPTAAAGPDQTASDADGTETVTLDGSGSSDPDGSILSYAWTEGPIVLGNSANISPAFAVGVHTVIITGTDDGGATASDDLVITVHNSATNNAPAAEDDAYATK